MMPGVILAMLPGEDRDFMEDLFRKYGIVMERAASGFFNERADIEDMVSESCEKMIKNIDKLRSRKESELEGYIYAIVVYTCINHYRRRKRLSEKLQSVSYDLQLREEGTSVERKVELREQVKAVLQALYTLPEKQREVMRLKFFYELKDEEIAQAVGLSVDSVRKYVSRARDKIGPIIYRDWREDV